MPVQACSGVPAQDRCVNYEAPDIIFPAHVFLCVRVENNSICDLIDEVFEVADVRRCLTSPEMEGRSREVFEVADVLYYAP